MKIENNILTLKNGRTFKSIGFKDIQLESTNKQLEVFKEYDNNKHDFVEMFANYFSFDKEANKLYELVFQNPMSESENGFKVALVYKG